MLVLRKKEDDPIAMEEPIIQKIAKKYGKTPAQVHV